MMMKLSLISAFLGALPILVSVSSSFVDDVIPDQYIVVLDERANNIVTRARLFLSQKRPKLLSEYRRGMIVSDLSGEVAEQWARDPAVLSIVPVSLCG